MCGVRNVAAKGVINLYSYVICTFISRLCNSYVFPYIVIYFFSYIFINSLNYQIFMYFFIRSFFLIYSFIHLTINSHRKETKKTVKRKEKETIGIKKIKCEDPNKKKDNDKNNE